MPGTIRVHVDLLADPDSPDAHAAFRALWFRLPGDRDAVIARVLPEDRYVVPIEGAAVRVLRQPWVRDALRAHLPVGAVVRGFRDTEVPPLPVRVTSRKTARVAQHAIRVPTPDGDVRLWPGEYERVRGDGDTDA